MFVLPRPSVSCWCALLVLFLALCCFLDSANSTNIDISTLGFNARYILTTPSPAANIAAGDINGDGKDDILVGSSTGNTPTGDAFVSYGGTQSSLVIPPSAFTNTSKGFSLSGIQGYNTSSYAVAVGNFNGDQWDDVALGYQYGSNIGQVYVVFGSSSRSAADIKLSAFTIPNSAVSGAILLNGTGAGSRFGAQLTAGDIDGDGIDELFVIAIGATTKTFVFWGSRNFTSLPQDASRFIGQSTVSTYGFGILSAPSDLPLNFYWLLIGDLNGDSIGDVVISSSTTSTTNEGKIYVIWGNRTRSIFGSVLNLGVAWNGFQITPDSGERTIGSVIAVGDVNNDSVDDIALRVVLTGYPYYYVKVFYGRKVGLSPSYGIQIPFYDSYRGPIVFADVNGDSFDDIVFASSYSVNVYFGVAGNSSSITNSYSISTPLPVTSLARGDFNGDKIDDVAVSFNGSVHVIYGTRKSTVLSISSPPTSGGKITIVGTNLGGLAYWDSLQLNGSSDVLTGIVGPGVGLTPISLGNAWDIITSYSYLYQAPTISSVSTISVQGGVVTITGTNFGYPEYYISVTIGGLSCLGLVFLTPHTSFYCTVPASPLAPQPSVTPLNITVTVSSTVGYAQIFYYYAVPIAVDDVYVVALNSPVKVFDVRTNDIDTNPGQTPVVIGVTQPNIAIHETAFLENGVVSYWPPYNFVGKTKFSYTITDIHQGVSIATVYVLVKPPPVAVDDTLVVAVNSTSVEVDVLSNDRHTSSLFVSAVGQPHLGGAVTRSDDGRVFFLPEVGFAGTTWFKYYVSDGELTSTASVTVFVNAADSKVIV